MATIQLRRGEAAAWTTANSVLAAGEVGLELDTGKFKWGDGTTAWNDLDYIGGDSSPVTDDVIQFTEQDGASNSYAILAVDLDAQTIEIAGDHALEFSFTICAISGSTGNDSNYDGNTATYDSGSDRTTITGFNPPLADATVDGDLEAPVIYTAEIVLAANRAVEWIFVETDSDWDSFEAYALIGDDSAPDFFISPSADMHAAGLWQWPQGTLGAFGTVIAQSGSGPNVYQLYPDGGTVYVRWGAMSGSGSGSTRIVVHHHDTEPGPTPTRSPAA